MLINSDDAVLHLVSLLYSLNVVPRHSSTDFNIYSYIDRVLDSMDNGC